MSEENWKVIARLRRAQPRNPDTMAICDAYEAAIVHIRNLEQNRERSPTKKEFDRAAYMRGYMRKYMRAWRARKKAEK